ELSHRIHMYIHINLLMNNNVYILVTM
uniref:Uncharacterized protein n=1 Tax=Amphimedon queenslandica TaxID=400682 RepID=A0A1X7UKV2_AMPQE